MTVVPLRAAADPRQSKRVEVYCVQSYWRDRRGLAKGKFQQFASREMALRAARTASVKAAGVVVYVMCGYPGTDTWDSPVVIGKLGEVSSATCG